MYETLQLLKRHDISLNEKLGQHVLVDAKALDVLANTVIPGSNVIEIGSGPGNLTSRIAAQAGNVIGVEIDRRYEPILEELKAKCSNIQMVYGNALGIDYEKLVRSHPDATWQIIANLPYHISEPFLEKMVLLKVENIVLTIGDNLAHLMQVRNPRSFGFSKLSLLSNTFFHVEYLDMLPKTAFYPQPRTDSQVVRLVPKDEHEYDNPVQSILRQLLTPKNRGLTVEKAIKNTMDGSQSHSKLQGKEYRHRTERRKVRSSLKNLRDSPGEAKNSIRVHQVLGGITIDSLGLPKTILSKPFFALNNSEIQILVIALQDSFGE